LILLVYPGSKVCQLEIGIILRLNLAADHENMALAVIVANRFDPIENARVFRLHPFGFVHIVPPFDTLIILDYRIVSNKKKGQSKHF